MNKKIIIFLILLFVVLALVAYWYYKERIFSKGILKLEILGPESVQMGQEIEYTVRYKNNSNFTLEQPKLIFEYPEYSINDTGKSIINQTLGDIYPGDEQFVKFKARLLGKEGDLKVFKALLSYQPKNLSARYESETTFTVKIETVPLNLDFDLPSKLESGKNIQFSINYFSNVDYKLSGLKINVTYPDKFEFSGAQPQPLAKDEWQIADLNKTEGGRIKIEGKTTEEAGKRIQFSAKLGIWQDGDFIVLKETTKEVEVIRPLLYISQQINGVSDYVASPGEKLHFKIYFKNIGDTPFENLFLINRLDGPAFDLPTLKADFGQVRTDDNMIIWDWKQVPELKYLDVQEEGNVEFNVNLKYRWDVSGSDINNTFIKNKVTLSDISQEFQTKVNSEIEISQKGLYQDEIFGNVGPNPPEVGQTTTYTIVWQAKNFYNDVKNVKVRTILAPGVVLTGKVSPEKEISKFSFDNVSREVVWNVGDVLAGTGVSGEPPTVYFQVSITPTAGQSGKIIPLVGETTISGEDQWTGKTTKGKAAAVDASLQNNSVVPEQSGDTELE